MKLHQFAMAALALSVTGALAAGNQSSASSEQQSNQSNQSQANLGQWSPQQSAKGQDQSAQGQSASGQSSYSAQAGTNGQSSSSQQGSNGQSSFSQQGSNGQSGFSSQASASADPQVRKAQQALQQKGHDPGQIDGIMGPNTKQALQSFQQEKGLSSSGRLDQKTLAALDIQGNGASGDLAANSAIGGTKADQPMQGGRYHAGKDQQKSGNGASQSGSMEQDKNKDKKDSKY